MEGNSHPRRLLCARIASALRAALALALIGLLGLEILPCGIVQPAPPGGQVQGERTFSIEPLQVCGHDDPVLGGLFDSPVLVPGASDLLRTFELHRLLPEAAALAPEEFRPSIDHPPRRAA